jgi:hypothetical protein
MLIAQINAVLAGWVHYFRVGHSSRAFSEIRDYVEMKIRTLLTRRKRRRKSSVGWRRWSNEYLYVVLGLYWDWILHPLLSGVNYSLPSAGNSNCRPSTYRGLELFTRT